MWLYILIILIPLVFFFNKKQEYDHSVLFLSVFIILITTFIGIADMLGGYDRYIYGELFDDVAGNLRNGNLFWSFIFVEYPKELGYDYLNVAIALLTQNRYIFILILTIIIYILTFVSFKKYMSNYPFALILFLALMFFFTFTYLRQILAVSISWLAIQYIIDRKIKKFLLVVAIAFLFHNSALILLPFYFLPVKKYNAQSVIIIMIVCLAIGATGITNTIYQAYGGLSESEERTADYAESSGFRVAYMIEAAFFLYLILSNYKRIPNDKTRIVLCNMSLTFCGILLFFIKSENGGRLSWFYMIGLISTLTYISQSIKLRTSQFNTIVLSVSFFLFLRILTQWSFSLYPYKTFFTNGHRKYDPVYEKYEYDYNYDDDKFYK